VEENEIEGLGSIPASYQSFLHFLNFCKIILNRGNFMPEHDGKLIFKRKLNTKVKNDMKLYRVFIDFRPLEQVLI
jgi:hypothetical protein